MAQASMQNRITVTAVPPYLVLQALSLVALAVAVAVMVTVLVPLSVLVVSRTGLGGDMTQAPVESGRTAQKTRRFRTWVFLCHSTALAVSSGPHCAGR